MIFLVHLWCALKAAELNTDCAIYIFNDEDDFSGEMLDVPTKPQLQRMVISDDWKINCQQLFITAWSFSNKNCFVVKM